MAEQQEIATGICSHERTEEVTTYGGTIIAFRCKGCAKVLCQYGKCDGCKKVDQKLTSFKGKGKGSKRYCDERCKSRAAIRERKEKHKLGKEGIAEVLSARSVK